MYQERFGTIQKDFSSYTTDEETTEAMKVIYGTSGYIVNHMACGLFRAKELLNYPNAIGVSPSNILLNFRCGTNFKRKATDSCTNRKCDR
jgi:hypothetical protein